MKKAASKGSAPTVWYETGEILVWKLDDVPPGSAGIIASEIATVAQFYGLGLPAISPTISGGCYVDLVLERSLPALITALIFPSPPAAY